MENCRLCNVTARDEARRLFVELSGFDCWPADSHAKFKFLRCAPELWGLARCYRDLMRAAECSGCLRRRLRLCGRQSSCAYCYDAVAPQVDHVLPLVRGGGNDVDNLVYACAGCNGSKGDRLFSEDEWNEFV